MGERELESRLEELLNVRPPDVLLLLNLGDSEDLDVPESGSVSGSHVLVHGLDGLGSGKGSELLDHVVRAGSRVVSEPDGEVLDLQGLLLVDLRVSTSLWDASGMRRTTWRATISPLAFLTFFNCRR